MSDLVLTLPSMRGTGCFQVTIAAWRPNVPRPANIDAAAVNVRAHVGVTTLYVRSPVPARRIWLACIGLRDRLDPVYPYEPFQDVNGADIEVDITVGTPSVSDAMGFGSLPVDSLDAGGTLLLCAAPPRTDGDQIQIELSALPGTFDDVYSGQATLLVGFTDLVAAMGCNDVIDGP